jgi:hypothetical protein
MTWAVTALRIHNSIHIERNKIAGPDVVQVTSAAAALRLVQRRRATTRKR